GGSSGSWRHGRSDRNVVRVWYRRRGRCYHVLPAAWRKGCKAAQTRAAGWSVKLPHSAENKEAAVKGRNSRGRLDKLGSLVRAQYRPYQGGPGNRASLCLARQRRGGAHHRPFSHARRRRNAVPSATSTSPLGARSRQTHVPATMSSETSTKLSSPAYPS